MAETTTIEWTDSTWNPWQGCTKVSLGCDNCYAETLTKRWGRTFTTLRRSADATFYAPLSPRWRTPRLVFTCSLSDFFHRQADPWREEAWDIMRRTPHLTYQVLTKRPGLAVAWYKNHGWLPNVWLGAAVENQKYAPRLDVLARVPAPVRFVSVEPMMGPVDLGRWLMRYGLGYAREAGLGANLAGFTGVPTRWVICGGESGRGARPMHPDWARSLRDQCQAAGVPFFFKQWGAWLPDDHCTDDQWHGARERYGREFIHDRLGEGPAALSVSIVQRWAFVGKKAAGALLDGREWREMPLSHGSIP